MATAASGRPAPRYAVVDTELVTPVMPLNETFGMSYTPVAIRIVIIGSIAPMRGNAPASWTTSRWYAVMRPSRVPPSFARCTWPRPWGIATMFSERVSVQRTGRPTARA